MDNDSLAEEKVKKPMNAFMLYRQFHYKAVTQANKHLHNGEVSKILGGRWKTLPDEEREPWVEEANARLREFKRVNPKYKHRYTQKKATPRKAGKQKYRALRQQQSQESMNQESSPATNQTLELAYVLEQPAYPLGNEHGYLTQDQQNAYVNQHWIAYDPQDEQQVMGARRSI
ncbi:high mobility group box domain-containing protein [Xylariaceae sp. AK1471]|nr:high mobility group box domain-containing protein [Xylariaceae sp. AK1471]